MSLITAEYKELNAELHARSERYGTSGANSRILVRQISDWGRKPILDYGCGKCTLSKALGPAYRVTNYDPCIKGLDTAPEPHPVVVCGDVLEHVEPECLDDVLKDLRFLTTDCLLCIIALVPSTQTLADGRNAHLMIATPGWWHNKLISMGFTIEQMKPEKDTVKSTWILAH